MSLTCPVCSHTWEPATKPLTVRQKQVLGFIVSHMAATECSPTYREIARRFGFKSSATVHEHITNLAAKGYLHRDYNRARGLSAVA